MTSYIRGIAGFISGYCLGKKDFKVPACMGAMVATMERICGSQPGGITGIITGGLGMMLSGVFDTESEQFQVSWDALKKSTRILTGLCATSCATLAALSGYGSTVNKVYSVIQLSSGSIVFLVQGGKHFAIGDFYEGRRLLGKGAVLLVIGIGCGAMAVHDLIDPYSGKLTAKGAHHEDSNTLKTAIFDDLPPFDNSTYPPANKTLSARDNTTLSILPAPCELRNGTFYCGY